MVIKPSIPDICVQDAIEQLTIERLNESKYLCAESYFSKWNLDGLKAKMRQQAEGESGHARLIINFLDARNANYRVQIEAYETPEFTTIGEWLNFWLKTEQDTTLKLQRRKSTAETMKDEMSVEFWRSMLAEQLDEEKEAMSVLYKADQLGILDLNLETFNMSDPIDYIKRKALIDFDNELGV